MKKPQFLPIIEIRKLWWNCWANCHWCVYAKNDEYTEWLELTKEQEHFIKKVNKVFNFTINKKENITLQFTIPFPFDKISFDEFKRNISELNIDIAWSFWFMLSDNIDDLNINLNDILEKTQYVFELNIGNTWMRKNSTLQLCSIRWWLKKLNEKKDDLINPIKKITELCKKYVKNEINLQIWRLVVSENNYKLNQREAKVIIEYINKQLEYDTEIKTKENESYSEYEIEINTNKNEKIIVHLALIKEDINYKEDINEHIKKVEVINSPLLLSTIWKNIQLNHSLWKANDEKNLINYNEIVDILEELNILKEKLIKINFLKNTNPGFFVLQKIKTIKEISIKEISIKKNIDNLLKSKNITDIERESIFTTLKLIDESEFKLVEHTERWLLPAYILWTYLRIKLLSVLKKNREKEDEKISCIKIEVTKGTVQQTV